MIRSNSFFIIALLSTTFIWADPAKTDHRTASDAVSTISGTAFEYKNYPTYENGTSISLTNRPLQALNIGTTFQRPRNAGNIGFIGGIYTEEGSLRSLGQKLSDNEPYCFVDPLASERPLIQSDKQANRNSCTLESIEGSEYLEKDKQQSMYRTKLELRCGQWNMVEITCHHPSNGEAKEMSLGMFEKIIATHFKIGNLVLDTPLVPGASQGFPIEEPVTPAQLMAGRLVFKLNDKTAMTFVVKEAPETSRYQQYFQGGAVLSEHPYNLNADMLVAIKTANGTALASPPTSVDINDMGLSNASIGYSKQSYGPGRQHRNTHLLLKGAKKINGVDTEITVYWSDPKHSHITYEGMWKIPGRKIIDNTVVLK